MSNIVKWAAVSDEETFAKVRVEFSFGDGSAVQKTVTMADFIRAMSTIEAEDFPVGGTQFEERQPVGGTRHERLAGNHVRHAGGGEESHLVLFGETLGTVVPEACLHEIAVLEPVRSTHGEP